MPALRVHIIIIITYPPGANVRAPPALSLNPDGPGRDAPRLCSKDPAHGEEVPARRRSVENLLSEINGSHRGSKDKLSISEIEDIHRGSKLDSRDKPHGSIEGDESILEDEKVKHFEMMRSRRAAGARPTGAAS